MHHRMVGKLTGRRTGQQQESGKSGNGTTKWQVLRWRKGHFTAVEEMAHIIIAKDRHEGGQLTHQEHLNEELEVVLLLVEVVGDAFSLMTWWHQPIPVNTHNTIDKSTNGPAMTE